MVWLVKGGERWYLLHMRVMGLDVGEKRIGIAISDELRWTAQGVKVLERRDLPTDLATLKDLIEKMGVSEVVVGLPQNMDGTYGEVAKKVMAFAQQLQAAIAIPVILWDERLSSAQARRLLLQADLSRKKRRRVIDKVAATIILQAYLDSKEEGGL